MNVDPAGMTDETPHTYDMDLSTTRHGDSAYTLTGRGMTAAGVRKILLTLPEAIRPLVQITDTKGV